MLRAERQAKILQIVRERGYIQNDELANSLGVTPATIRRDLKTLNEQRLIQQDHGGAYNIDALDGSAEPLYETKVYVNRDAKRLIGAAAAASVCDNETIMLDSGTTNAEIAQSLLGLQLRNLTVVTTDLIVARLLCPASSINVLMVGGLLRKSFYSAYGPYTESILRNIRADRFFLGIDAASESHGISNIVLEEVPIKQLMIQNSDRVIMVADGTKFGMNAPYRICSWDDVDCVITDQCISAQYLDFFATRSIDVQVVHRTSLPCETPA
jgi:DeoR/GlpR family transcriptional regulator of sugar metabolism